MTKKEECLKALQCLYLAVDASIADDVKRKVLEALDEANKNFVLADVSGQLCRCGNPIGRTECDDCLDNRIISELES